MQKKKNLYLKLSPIVQERKKKGLFDNPLRRETKASSWMLWFTDPLRCIYIFDGIGLLEGLFGGGLHSERPEPCIKAPRCGHSRPDGNSFIRVEWENQCLWRCRSRLTESPLSARGHLCDGSCRGERERASIFPLCHHQPPSRP